MPKRILVVGGLAAGPSAASKAKRFDPNLEVVLFEAGEYVSSGICEMPYYIAGQVERHGLITYTPDKLKEKKGVDVRTLHRAEEVHPTRRLLVVRDLKTGTVREERYDRLIIATGSRARSLGVDGEGGRNIFSVKTLEDGFAIEKFIEAEKPQKAVIIGGGYIGMEMADAFRSRGMDVTLFHLDTLPMAGLERGTRERVRKELEENGVRFMPRVKTEGFVVDKSHRATHVVTDSGSFETECVILSLGVEPNTTLARTAGVRLGEAGGILTDQRQQTNIDNIFAAGDCCEVRNLVNNRSMYLPLATVASKAAWVAGENVAGGSASFRGAVRAIAVKVFGLEVAHVGLSSEEAISAGFDVVTETITAWSKVAVMPESSRIWITTIADRKSKRLLGVNIYGTQGAVLRANTFAVAIQHRIRIDEIQQWDLAYSPPFTPLWDPILVAANVLAKKV